MSSVAEKEINNFMSGTLSNTRILVLFGVLGAAMLIGVSIKDQNMKICFYLSFMLIVIGLINLNLAVTFYIKLRNEKGIEGPRGERGDKGPKGFPGRCELNLDANCEIKNCRPKITDRLMKQCPHYGETVSKRDVDRTVEENKMLSKYNRWIDEISKQCGSHQDEEQFFQKVFEDTSKYCLV